MIISIDIKDLLLDTKNPRIDEVDSQDAALLEIVDDQKDKLVRLANDIATNGVNPAEFPIVIPLESSGKYVVLEGNRRLAAIRLLTNLSDVEKIQSSTTKNQFLELRQGYRKIDIVSMQCVVVKNREEASHWIQLRHTGENQGVGVVKWNAEASTRFSQQLGQSSNFNNTAVQVIEYLQKQTLVSDDTKAKLDDVRLTNLARLVNDKDVKKAVGLKVKNGILEIELPHQDVIAKLSKIIDDVSSPDFKVDDIYHKPDRLNYLAKLEESFHTPDNSGGAGNDTADQGSSEKNGVEDESTKGHQVDQGERKRTTKPLPTDRKQLIPSKTILKIHHPRINKIYHELRKLEVDDFTNCAAVMLRVFLELSVDEYSKTKKIPAYSPKAELFNKLKAIAQFLEVNKILDATELKAIRMAAETPDSLISTNTLNAYVHNPNVAPKATELKITWDNLEKFIIKLWE